MTISSRRQSSVAVAPQPLLVLHNGKTEEPADDQPDTAQRGIVDEQRCAQPQPERRPIRPVAGGPRREGSPGSVPCPAQALVTVLGGPSQRGASPPSALTAVTRSPGQGPGNRIQPRAQLPPASSQSAAGITRYGPQ